MSRVVTNRGVGQLIYPLFRQYGGAVPFVLAPTISAVTPSRVPVGSANTQITVAGTGFISTSVLRFDGADLATTYDASGPAPVLKATITAAQMAAAGAHQVSVFSPAPGRRDRRIR